MITVEVEIPLLGRTIEFRAEEDAKLSAIREAVLEALPEEGGLPAGADPDAYWLWERTGGELLVPDRTAAEMGLRSGAVLVLA